jgi:hypothetical protein
MEEAEKESAEVPKVLRPVSKQHKLRRSPKDYDWQAGERVVLVILTGAGVVPTSTYGCFIEFIKQNGRKVAVVAWDNPSTKLGCTVAVQRIRPIALIPR